MFEDRIAGIQTVLADDPMLNCRMEGGRSPVRIICDSRLRIPLDSQIVKTAAQIETIVAWNRERAEKDKGQGTLDEILRELAGRGVILMDVPARKRDGILQLDLGCLMQKLAERGIDSILLEGGGTLNASILREGLVQRIYAFVAPKLVAGAKAKSPVEGVGISRMRDAVLLQETETTMYGKDICITGRIGGKECLPEL